MKLYIFAMLLYGTVSVLSEMDFLEENLAQAFLESYGYMDYIPAIGSRFGEPDPEEVKIHEKNVKEKVVEAIKDFQFNYEIQWNGELNDITKLQMARPRCGVLDPILRDNKKRTKRYLIKGPKWDKTHLTWRLKSTKPNQVQFLIRKDLRDAFEVWQTNTVFTFQETYEEKPDILIEFFRLDHGDGGPFDGPGKTLAHAFYPDSGDVHFDDDESWNFGRDIERNKRGSNFFDAAVHELGHTLGLGHSKVNKAIMFPSMAHDKRYLKLNEDEINGIEAIYGSESTYIPSPTEKPEIRPDIPSDIPDCCNTSYDAITNFKGEVFIFKDKYVWRITKNGVMHGYPVPIRRMWSSLPSDLVKVDAVYENYEGKIVIFTKIKYYIFEGNRITKVGSLPDLGISENVGNIDAIFTWGRTNETFIFSGDVYWKFNETAQRVHDGYPQKTTRVWKKVDLFDSAFQKDGITYFFKGLNYFEFDDKFLKLSQEPKRSAQQWMMCPEPEVQEMRKTAVRSDNPPIMN